MTTRRRMTEVLRQRLHIKAYVQGHKNKNVLSIITPDGQKTWTFDRTLTLPWSTVMEGSGA
jgi:hypothetical protein